MRFRLALLLFFLAPLLDAAPIQYDLGFGLHYFRLHILPDDLPDATTRAATTILDLRYVHGDAASATALQGWLRFHAQRQTPVFVLANQETSATLLAPLAHGRAVTGVVLIGAAGPDFLPDIAVHVAPDTERRAYDALEHGALVSSLLTDNPDKPRNDEARLAHDHLSDSAANDDSSDEATGGKKEPPAPSPLIDVTLQRAVQLQRALLALKKI